MNKINQILKSLTLIFTIAVLVSGCGSKEVATIEDLIASGDMESIRAKKKELTDQQKEIQADITLLDSTIAANTEIRNVPLVTTFKAELENFSHYVELQGDVTTKQNVLIYPEAAGALIKVYVEKGQRVKKGQKLATIDDGGMFSQLAQLKAQLDLAKTTYERQERLWKQDIGSEIQYLQAKTNYEAQKAVVDQMESQLAKYVINAPFSGIIDDVIKDQGTVVTPGGPGTEVFRIVNLSNMYIEVPVPETYISSIKTGKNVKIHFPILNETVESKVRETGNFINPDNRSFTAEIPVPNKSGNIKPNLTARVQINDYSNKEAILIPQSIISENAEGEQYVFVVSKIDKENLAEANKKIIKTGKTQGDLVEVLAGIGSGESIIEEGARSVKDGQQVKILTK